jgi:hypothetical protein
MTSNRRVRTGQSMRQPPYPDATEIVNHRTWQPGWGLGARYYGWFITLQSPEFDELHQLIDTYQAALAHIPYLDLIPRQWRHLTIQGVGHREEVGDQIDDVAAVVQAWSRPVSQVPLHPLSPSDQQLSIARRSLFPHSIRHR